MHDFETLNAKTTKSIKRNTKRKSNSAQDLLMLEFLKFLSSKMHQTCICSNFSAFSSLFRNVSPSHQSSPKKWRNLRNSRICRFGVLFASCNVFPLCLCYAWCFFYIKNMFCTYAASVHVSVVCVDERWVMKRQWCLHKVLAA